MTKETVKRQATSIFFSANPNPLQNWDKEVKDCNKKASNIGYNYFR